jgi:hypothetical protein
MMMDALEPDMLDGGCNDGFLRDDALLAVIELTGTGDNLTPGTPQSWYDALVAAKHGNEEAVVILAFCRTTSTCRTPSVRATQSSAEPAAPVRRGRGARTLGRASASTATSRP